MTVRVTVEISEVLYERLRHAAENSGTSIRSLIVRALEVTYADSSKRRVTGPLIPATGKRGPQFPCDENPHELVVF